MSKIIKKDLPNGVRTLLSFKSTRWKWLVLCFLCVNTQFVNSLNLPPRFVLPEGQNEIVLRLREGPETPVGTVVYRLVGKDPDGDSLTFGLQGKLAQDLFQIQRVSGNEADLVLQQELDREIESEYTIILTLTDGRLTEGSFVTQSLLVLVEDINDNEPVFKPFPTSVTVRENGNAPQVIATVEAVDRDEGAYGQVVYSLTEPDGDGKTFDVTTENGKGVVRVLRLLDYEEKSLHQIVITASDRAISGPINNSSVSMFIRVLDEEDQPPVFVGVAAVTRVAEDVPVGTSILKVKAIDGDRGVDNPIVYSLVSGNSDMFEVDPQSGVVKTRSSLDRESPSSNNGAFMITIEARELSSRSTIPSTTTTEVTIIVLDVNDETPTFASHEYAYEIAENSPIGTTLTILSDALPQVSDHDLGSNGTFRLSLVGNGSEYFTVTPAKAINDAVFVLKVAQSAALDYETVQEFKFNIVAEELVSESPKSSVSSITVFVRDANDNSPVFERSPDQVAFPEDIPGGAVIMSVSAKDADTGRYGKAGIRYTKLDGVMSDLFRLDADTGEIRTADDAKFDRESIADFFLTAEARDDNGEGNRGYTKIHVFLIDYNDNAPEFTQNLYHFRIKENQQSFETPAFVKATDRDQNGTLNSQVRYSLVLPNPYSANFTINPQTGELGLTSPLDFEQIEIDSESSASCSRKIDLKVKANDLGDPEQSSVTSVRVHVEDVNDHVPVFVRENYLVSVPEDLPEGTSIIQVRAEDADGCAPNNIVLYRLLNFLDKFSINSSTGLISTAQGSNLDPDQTEDHKDLYDLKVMASDSSLIEGSLSSTVSVLISVEDVNNKKPVIVHPEIIRVSEGVEVGTEIFKFSAFDPDEDAVLRFSIDGAASEGRNEDGLTVQIPGAGVSTLFKLDSETGSLSVAKPLDREMYEVIRLAFLVEDLAAKNGRQISSDVLTIVIDDVNDNDPEFLKKYYIAFVPENSPEGTFITSVAAKDVDRNRTVTYSLSASPEITPLIMVKNTTGDITVIGQIDREIYSWLNFSVIALDSGIPPRNSSVPVYIQVFDENDNNPLFIDPPSNLTVSEGAPLGTKIFKFHATDADAGDFGTVTFLLDRFSSNGKFGIDSESGELFVASHLDREEQDAYSLIVQALDNQRYSDSVNSRKSFHQVTVSVSDINDQKPVLSLPRSCIVLSELHPTGDTVATISAHDLDDINTPNGKVVFGIESGNSGGFFGIENLEQNTARVFTRKSLRGSYGNYTLSLKAKDLGEPSNLDKGELRICVNDYNDNSPYFIYPPQNASIKIFENITRGESIIQVKAKDDDTGLNAQIKYELRKDALGHWKIFAINETSGVISLVGDLDSQRQKYYELRIEARDLGSPASLSSELDLIIVVKSVNDDIPRFDIESVQYNFTENIPPGVESYKLPDVVEREEVFGNVCFLIVTGDDFSYFDLDSNGHVLKVAKPLDREHIDFFKLEILASDDCSSPATVNPASVLYVNVFVTDQNDNAPTFVRNVFTGGVITNAVYGSEILSVTATDADLNDELTYFMVGEIQQSLAEGLEAFETRTPQFENAIAEELIRSEEIQTPFLLNKTSGVLTLNFDPQPGMKGHFEFQVLVRDSAGLRDNASVLVYLLRGDQRVKFLVRQSPITSRSKIDAFKDALENVTDLIVNIDEIRVHRNVVGFIDKTKSELYLHFVQPVNNSVVEADEVLKMLDTNVEKLDAIFKEFNVLDTSPAEMGHLSSKTSLQEEAKDLAFVWASVIAGILGLLILLLLGLCIFQRNQLMRKLRAATAASYGSDPSRLNTMLTVPNTNRHREHGSNPIWQSDHEQNDWFKDDDMFSRFSEIDVADSLDDNIIIETVNTEPRSPTKYSHLVNTAGPLETINRNVNRRSGTLESNLEHRNQEDSSSSKEGEAKEKIGNISDYHRNIFQILDKMNNPLLQGKPIETTEL